MPMINPNDQGDPYHETRYENVPATPGWFVVDWVGTPDDYTIDTKAPIVAWMVESKLYPRKVWTKSNLHVQTGEQDWFTDAHPVAVGGVLDNSNVKILGPDGCVYQHGVRWWSDVASWVKCEYDELEAKEAESAKAKPKRKAAGK